MSPLLDIFLWALIALFVVWEAFAHFIAKNREAHTLSNRIWALEKKYPKSRILVVAAIALLFVHLVFPT